jgi:di/tricarboxylate transporter
MAIYWMTEALPLPITSLIPVVAFPLFGILDTGKVCMAYMKVHYGILYFFLSIIKHVDPIHNEFHKTKTINDIVYLRAHRLN